MADPERQERQPFKGLIAQQNEDRRRREQIENMKVEERKALQARFIKSRQGGGS